MTQADDIKALKKEVLTLKKRVKKLEAQAPTQDEEEDVVETPEEIEETKTPTVQKRRTPSKPVPIGTILGWIGAVILGLGFIFLVTYAIDQGWLSKTLQIILGVLAGGVITGAGYALTKKTKLQGELLMGTGVALAYFSVYAGYALETYRAATGLGVALTITLLIVVLFAAALLSIKQASGALLIETVLLAHITTLLTAMVLMQFGTGPIKGFAVTLSVGILISL